MRQSIIAETSESLLAIIAKQQRLDGSFWGASSSSLFPFQPQTRYVSPFITALVLSCLSGISSAATERICKKAASYLLTQKSRFWTFNYWQRGSLQSKQKPYADDLDDTFCALAALTLHDKTLLRGDAMAKIVESLTAVETREGGPYRSWYIDESAPAVWKDVDIVVNSNVAFFLSLHDIRLPNLLTLLEQSIAKQELRSPYYPSICPVLYFISRWYQGKDVQRLIELASNALDTKEVQSNSLDTALVLITLLRFSAPLEMYRSKLESFLSGIDPKRVDAYGFCMDPSQDGHPRYGGSVALTAAFLFELIWLYRQKNVVSVQVKDREALDVYEQAVGHVRQSLTAIFPESQTLKTLEEILASDGDSKQIVLLPYITASSLRTKASLPPELLVRLGEAGLYGWVAYTLYDNFLDDEAVAKQLPVANVAHRKMISRFEQALPGSRLFNQLFHAVLDELEQANYWEVTRTRVLVKDGRIDVSGRLPDYGDLGQLARKSLGHALGAIAVLIAAGSGRQDTVRLRDALFHYLLVRQLNDDAHDWEKDLSQGHINAAGAMVLECYFGRAPRNKRVHLKRTKKQLQTIFWERVLPDICGRILSHCHQARQSIYTCRALKEKDYFYRLIEKYERVATNALEKRDDAALFLQTYQRG